VTTISVKTNLLWDGKSLYELYSRGFYSMGIGMRRVEEAHKQGLVFSSPFDTSSIDFFKKIKCLLTKLLLLKFKTIL
jgi:sialic acid synthase SpsE